MGQDSSTLENPFGQDPGHTTPRAWLFSHIRPQRWRLALVLALSFSGTALALAQPLLTKYLIDDGLLAGQFSIVLQASALLLAAALIASLLGGINRWWYVRVSGDVLFGLRESVYRHLQTLSPGFFARTRRGDLLSRLDGDVAEIQRFAVDSALAAINAVLALIGSLALMFGLSWQLALLAFLFLPAQVVFLRRIRPRVEARTRTVRERNADVTSFLVDSLGFLKLTQAVGAQSREAERLRGLNKRYLSDLLRLEMVAYAATAIPGALAIVGTAAVFLSGGYLVIEGAMTVGTLIAFSFYLARAVGPLQTLLGLYVAVRRARVSLQRVWELLSAEAAVSEPESPRSLPAQSGGALVFDAVRFGYPDNPPVLEGASAAIAAGSCCVIRGESGAGKSTLIDLLHRHYDPVDGCLRLDGIDLRDLALDELRRKVAVVAQEAPIVPGTVADNVRYAQPAAEEAAVIRAVQQAELGDWIHTLPEGLETPIDACGERLSGGQRQRLAIARALLQQPRVLILDEATSAVDAATEQRLVQTIDTLFADTTRLIVTHRPEVWAHAEQHLVLEAGQLKSTLPPVRGVA